MERRPDSKCPKCGWEVGFLHSKPTYLPAETDREFGDDLPERLLWDCTICGYTVYTKTADAK